MTTLPVQRRMAAMLDARGTKRDEIARAVGVAGKTISDWRNDAAYQQEVAEWGTLQLEHLNAMYLRVKSELFDANMVAIATLVKAAQQEDDEGVPTARAIDAAGKLLNKLEFREAREREGAEGASAAAAVIIVQRADGDEVVVLPDSQVREVTDGGDR